MPHTPRQINNYTRSDIASLVRTAAADDRMSSFPPACCCWQGTCREGLRRRGGRRRAGPGRGPQPAVWRGAAVLRRLWPPSLSCCWGGWLVLLLRVCNVCRAVGGGLQSGATLICVRLDIGSLPPRSSSPTVTGCRLGGFPVGRDLWVESALWEGCYPASALAHGVCVIVYL